MNFLWNLNLLHYHLNPGVLIEPYLAFLMYLLTHLIHFLLAILIHFLVTLLIEYLTHFITFLIKTTFSDCSVSVLALITLIFLYPALMIILTYLLMIFLYFLKIFLTFLMITVLLYLVITTECNYLLTQLLIL